MMSSCCRLLLTMGGMLGTDVLLPTSASEEYVAWDCFVHDFGAADMGYEARSLTAMISSAPH